MADPAPQDPTPTPTPAPSDPPPADPPAPTDPPATDKQPPWGKPEDFDADKAWDLIQSLRKEKGADKIADLEQRLGEMTNAQKAQMDAIATALGLKSDDTPPDPDALAAQVQAEQAKARESALQLAVYRAAGANEANPDRLLDSSSFLRSVAEVDPTDVAAVSAAIAAAVEANPVFKASPTTPTTPPFPGGPRTPAPKAAGSLGEAIAGRFAGNNR